MYWWPLSDTISMGAPSSPKVEAVSWATVARAGGACQSEDDWVFGMVIDNDKVSGHRLPRISQSPVWSMGLSGFRVGQGALFVDWFVFPGMLCIL